MAKEAGVSTATVSRVINNLGGYSAETEAKVKKTIEECGFTPNVNAIGLRTNKSHSIGVIVPDITNNFFAKIIHELDLFFLKHKYSLLICDSNEDYNLENMHINNLVEKNVDGIIYISGQNEIKNINNVRNIPVVYIDRAPQNAEVLILSDNEEGGYLAGKELISKGCKKILFLRDKRLASTIRQRRRGLLKALDENNLSLDNVMESTCYPVYEDARDAIEKLLDEEGCFFDGIFATNDVMALGCIHALKNHNISVPQQVKVIGFDNVPFSEFSNPPITTISQDTEALALKAGQTALDLICRKKIKDKVTIIPVTLVKRDST